MAKADHSCKRYAVCTLPNNEVKGWLLSTLGRDCHSPLALLQRNRRGFTVAAPQCPHESRVGPSVYYGIRNTKYAIIMVEVKRMSGATQEIRTAVERGHYQQARVLASAMRTEWPDAVEGWLWSTWLSDMPEHAVRYAEHALMLRHDAMTQKAVEWARARRDEAQKGLASPEELDEISQTMAALPVSDEWDRDPPRWMKAWDVALAVVFVLLIGGGAWVWYTYQDGTTPTPIVYPDLSPAIAAKHQAEALWAAGQRDAALVAWQQSYDLDSSIPDVAISLARAHVALSTEQLKANDPDSAYPHLAAAYQLMPDEPAVLHEYQALKAYITGRDAVHTGDWAIALDALAPLYEIDRGYLDVAALIGQATEGKAQSAQFGRNSAERAFEQARDAAPGLALRTLFTPPEISNQPGQETMPPLPPLMRVGNKHIVVSINAQRMYVYENGALKWEWTASTGESERPTIPGHYRIQSQIENARSNVWELWMPYWQGLYWAGSVENGIHGQVEFDSGGRLWEGYLGTRITFGCVMISDTNAATLYNWAEVGTPVSIQWDWDSSWVPNANGNRS